MQEAPPENSSYLEQLEALEIPENIDPVLLALWREREEAEVRRQMKASGPIQAKTSSGRSLCRLFAAFIGVTALCLVILLGLLNGREPGDILTSACQAFLFYCILGFFVGFVAEKCVQDSVESLLREMIRRSDHTEPQAEPGVGTASDAVGEGS